MADLVESLTAEQLQTRSLCEAWSVNEVVGRLEATDLGWAWGSGPPVRGTAEAVMPR